MACFFRDAHAYAHSSSSTYTMSNAGDEATDLAIQGTNTSSITSKRSLERLGYLDPCHVPNSTERDSPLMFKYVVPKPSRRSPVINRAYYQRTQGIRVLVEGWIDACEAKGVETCAVVSLGCGFDPTFFRLATLRKQKTTGTTLKYVDIDYPTLITERLYMVRKESKLFDLLPEDPSVDDIGGFVSESYSCVGVDLRNLDQLETALKSAGIQKDGKRMPILVVSEVVLAYLGLDESDAVIRYFAQYPEATFVLHEQCIPTFDPENEDENLHPFAVTMFRHFERTMTPLRTLQEYRSLEDHQNRLQELGWANCDILNMTLFTDYVVMTTPEEHQRICELEPFDEYDELYWIGAYYFMAVASSGSQNSSESPDVLQHIGLRAKLADTEALSKAHVDQSSYLTSSQNNVPSSKVAVSSPSTPVSWSDQVPFPGLEVNRKGHTLTVLGDQAFVFGGFGVDANEPTEDPRVFQLRPQQQSRLGSLIQLDLKTGTGQTLPRTEDGPAPRMYHAAAATLDGSAMYVYSGRDGPAKVHNDVWRFTPEDGWDPLWRGRMNLQEDTAAPKGLYKHTANMMMVSGREMLVIFGGCISTGVANEQIYAFDLQEGQWGRFDWRTPGPESRIPGLFSHSAVVMSDADGQNSQLIVIGGIRALDEQVQNGVWKVSLGVSEDGQCWAEASKLPMAAMNGEELSPRFGHTAVAIDEDRIWVFGGVSAPGLLQWHETVIEIQPSRGSFTPLKLSKFKELVMVGHATALDPSRGRVLGIGGGGTCFGFGAWWDNLGWALML